MLCGDRSYAAIGQWTQDQEITLRSSEDTIPNSEKSSVVSLELQATASGGWSHRGLNLLAAGLAMCKLGMESR
jgi:hypothetical protein